MRTNFAIFVMARSIIGGHATLLLPGCALPFGRHEHAPDTGLPGARYFVPSLQLLAKSTGLPAADSFRASTIQGGAASVAGTKEVVGKTGRLLNAVILAAFLSSGSSDCLIGGSAVSAAGGVGAVRGDTLAILSGDHDRFGLESTATGHDVALDVDNAIRSYLTGKPTKNQSLLHEGGNGSGGETLSGPVRSVPVRSGPVRSGSVRSGPVRFGPVWSGSVAADQAEDAEKGHQVKQVSRKLQAGGLLGRGAACLNHDKCQGKCKGDRGEDMKCRVKLADCKRYGHHSIKRWGCPDGWACAPIGDLKWGSCTAAPTVSPTGNPTTAPTKNPTIAPTPLHVTISSPLDGGGWTMVWKHAYGEVCGWDLACILNGQYEFYSTSYVPCSTSAKHCNIPSKHTYATTGEQMIVAYHGGVVQYAYKGGFNSKLDVDWTGADFAPKNTYTQIVDRCTRFIGVPPEPASPLNDFAVAGITFDKYNYGSPTNNCDTDRYRASSNGDCRFENCQPVDVGYHNEMTLAIFVR